jgi:hypothetical protein
MIPGEEPIIKAFYEAHQITNVSITHNHVDPSYACLSTPRPSENTCAKWDTQQMFRSSPQNKQRCWTLAFP